MIEDLSVPTMTGKYCIHFSLKKDNSKPIKLILVPELMFGRVLKLVLCRPQKGNLCFVLELNV